MLAMRQSSKLQKAGLKKVTIEGDFRAVVASDESFWAT
jgi:hypothetical protein